MSALEQRRAPQRLRRLAVIRVLLRPLAAARLLQGLADEAGMNELKYHAVIRACVLTHWRPPGHS